MTNLTIKNGGLEMLENDIHELLPEETELLLDGCCAVADGSFKEWPIERQRAYLEVKKMRHNGMYYLATD